MRITLIAVGTKMPDWVASAFDEYIRRLPPHVKFSLKEVRAETRGDGGSTAEGMLREGERILAAVPQGATPIVLDERGAPIDSQGLAKSWARWQNDGVHPVLIIGGADGIAPSVKAVATAQWSLSALTLPHAMVRVLVAEQLYRAHTIDAGHPYHRT